MHIPPQYHLAKYKLQKLGSHPPSTSLLPSLSQPHSLGQIFTWDDDRELLPQDMASIVYVFTPLLITHYALLLQLLLPSSSDVKPFLEPAPSSLSDSSTSDPIAHSSSPAPDLNTHHTVRSMRVLRFLTEPTLPVAPL
jgi:hypothetical protein